MALARMPVVGREYFVTEKPGHSPLAYGAVNGLFPALAREVHRFDCKTAVTMGAFNVFRPGGNPFPML